MYRRSSTLILAALVLVAGVVACGGSFSTANIGDSWLSTDEQGDSRTSAFAQDEIFYAQAELRNAPDDTKIKAAWYAVNAEGVDPDFFIDEAELTSGDARVHFQLENDALWPVGEYKVELYLNDTLTKTLNFQVR